jgi:hypothetical protein
MQYNIYSIFSEEDIIITGRLNEHIWDKAQFINLGSYDSKPTPHHYATKLKSFWTEKFLYFGIEGEFDTIQIAPEDATVDTQGKTPRLWAISDVYEIFIGPDAKITKKYREIQIAPDSRWIDLTLDASGKERIADFKWTSGMNAKSYVDYIKKLWTATLQIPFTAFSRAPRESDIWNCNFYRISENGGKKIYLSWSPVFELRFHQPDKYGDLVFSNRI